MNKIDRDAELQYMSGFIMESDLSEELARNQLRCLWTAYCFHYNLDVDTDEYDTDLMDLWNAVSIFTDDNEDWNDFDSFDVFLCKYLV